MSKLFQHYITLRRYKWRGNISKNNNIHLLKLRKISNIKHFPIWWGTDRSLEIGDTGPDRITQPLHHISTGCLKKRKQCSGHIFWGQMASKQTFLKTNSHYHLMTGLPVGKIEFLFGSVFLHFWCMSQFNFLKSKGYCVLKVSLT